MAGNPDHHAHCHACGHLIEGRVRTYRCPKCGSYDVALIPLPQTAEHEETTLRLDPGTPIRRIHPARYLLPRAPRGVPKALWVRLRPLRFLVGPLLVLAAAGPFACLGWTRIEARQTARFPPTSLPWWSTWVGQSLLQVGLVASLGIALMPRLARRRLRRLEREIIDDEFGRCLECGYALKGLPDEHRCPECGEPYKMTMVKKTWERYFEAQKPKQ
jgi:predicted RNA-binding Zn-ribbon protein involved in translation (DUF1610 family)